MSRGAKTGYECKFAESPPAKELQSDCPICLLVLREPNLVSCCGYNFCETCIAYVQKDGKPCPMCKEPGFTVMANKGLMRALSGFMVRCSNQPKGCAWVGELGQLDGHINDSPQPKHQLDGCTFAELECLYCEEHMRRNVIATHQNECCPKRPHTCEYCEEYESTYDDVISSHYAECQHYLLHCPNNCQLLGSGIKRQNLEHHIKEECPLTVVECELHYAGCEVKTLRKDMAGHMKENAAAHISMLAVESKQLKAENLRLTAECRQLREDTDKLLEALELGRKASTQEKETVKIEASSLPERVQEEPAINQVEGELVVKLEERHQQIIPIDHIECKLTTYNELQGRQQDSLYWYSPPFYSHVFGYKMYLYVDITSSIMHAVVKGRETATIARTGSVSLYIMCSEYTVHWPIKGTITIQLLNQFNDKEHHTMKGDFGPIDNPRLNNIYFYSDPKSLACTLTLPCIQTGLEAKNCQYLKDDCIVFRVLSCEMDAI